MANANRPTGLSPVKHLTGAPYNGQANLYSIAAGYGTALAIGDPVVLSGSADGTGIAGITLAADSGALLGTIVGLGKLKGPLANPADLDQIIKPASEPDVWYALVADATDLIFEIQESGTPMTAADVGLNTNLASGTNNGFVSGWQLDNADKATTNTLQVQLLGLAQRQDNAFGTYAKWLVRINNHQLANGATGV